MCVPQGLHEESEQCGLCLSFAPRREVNWIPACAGMTFGADAARATDVIPEAELREAIGDPPAHARLKFWAGFPLARE